MKKDWQKRLILLLIQWMWMREEEDRLDAAMTKVAAVKPFFNKF